MIRLGSLFSGIGAIEQALIRLGVDYEVSFACDNGDVELNVLDKAEQKRMNDLYKRSNSRQPEKKLSPEEWEELKSLQGKEKDITDTFVAKAFALPDKTARKAFADELYAKYSRKGNYVKQTYMANYDVNEDNFYQDIRFLDGNDFRDHIDLLVGGSPCQSFSSVGAQRGLEDTRGTLFYEFARIVRDSRPKVFIYENVRGLTTHDNGETWKTIQAVFKNDLHYRITEPKVLDAVDYGIPQHRRRLFVIGIREDIICKDFVYPEPAGECPYTMQDFLEDNCAYGDFGFNKETGELVVGKSKGEPDHHFWLTDKVRDYVLKSGTKNFKTSVETDKKIARTLLKTMTQHHRAGVDNYITVQEKPKKILRSLTPRECLRLMGYPDTFKIVVSAPQMFRQAGNSIVVDVMMAIVRQIIKTGAIL